MLLGFGAAAVNAACALRAEGYAGRITVVTDAGVDPYSPVLTSYYAGGRIERDACNPWADLDLAHVVDDVRAHARIESLDVAAHEVVLENGDRLRYSKLLVATGAHPIAPGFPQVEGYTPLVLRTMADAVRLRDALTSERCRDVLVSGTSMVALKVLEACLDRGKRVTLLGRSSHILRASAHPLVAQRFEEELVARGVELRLRQTVRGAEPADADARVEGGLLVTFGTGEAQRFDEVVLAQGVEPNLDFVPRGALDADRGLIVDRFMRTSAPDVFAAGDVAQALDLSTGAPRVIGLWQNAVQQGRCAGRAMAAELAGRLPTRPYPGSIPRNVIHVGDVLFASVGSPAEDGRRRIEVRESPSALRVLIYEERAGQDAPVPSAAAAGPPEPAGQDALVGFNMLVMRQVADRREFDSEVGARFREIMKSYLRQGGDGS